MSMETATFAGGCFWCFEAVFKRLKGVDKAISGYAGGQTDNPSYDQVTSGASGHAEAVQVEFDPQIIPYEQLVEIFFRLHNPTTINRQGADVGSQYRSIIFYHSGTQKEIAQDLKRKFESEKVYPDPIVTEILPFTKFYKAEEYHQDYYEQNRNSNPYCRIVIDPKIQKLYADFKERVKR